MKVERFKNSWKIVKVFTVCFSIVLLMILLKEKSLTSSLVYGTISAFITVFLLWLIGHVLTWLKIIDEKRLVFKDELFVVRKTLIQNIRKIERVRMYHGFKRQGARMKIWYIKNGDLKHFHIREWIFDAPELKKIMLRLQELNPHIELAEQYQNLIAGKWDDKMKDFHHEPAPIYGNENLTPIGIDE